MKELSHRAFRAWLESRSPHGSLGEARQEQRCPLATYLGPGWRVRKRTARYVEPGIFPGVRGPEVRRVVLPEWARRFVAVVDDLPELPAGGPRRVWPGKALEVLDDIEAGIALERRRG